MSKHKTVKSDSRVTDVFRVFVEDRPGGRYAIAGVSATSAREAAIQTLRELETEGNWQAGIVVSAVPTLARVRP